MRVPTLRRLAHHALWFSLGLNVGVVGSELVRAHYPAAGLQSLAVAVAAMCLWLLPKAEGWLDARLGEAEIRQQMVQEAFALMRESRRRGDARITVTRNGVSLN